jgi:hypothetical protein
MFVPPTAIYYTPGPDLRIFPANPLKCNAPLNSFKSATDDTYDLPFPCHFLLLQTLAFEVVSLQKLENVYSCMKVKD